uniref:CCHC-type domain-containing protein n=1 Tax=Tanacetum cinerariifolium TaxID=118510 RepID=A0A6L2P9G9_TANCI|nr:hypothetical protein [Tanacetum cinerariifolium]
MHDGQIVTEMVQRGAPGNTGTKGIQTTGSGVNNSGKKVICYNCRREGHVARQCKEPKHARDSQWYHDKAFLMQAKEKGAVLDAKAEAFLADVECTALYDQPLVLTTTNLFEANHEDAYDSDVDKGPHAFTAFMANISSTGGTNGSSSSHINEQEEHLNSEVDSVLDHNMITYDEYQNDFGVETVPTVKIAAQKAEIAILNAKTVGNKTSRTTKLVNPKVIALGMDAISPKYIAPQRRTNRETPIPLPKKKQVTFQETPKPSPRFTKKPVTPLLKKPNVNVPLSTGIKSATGASKPASKSNA